MSKAIITFYLAIIILLLSFFYFTCSRKSQTEILHSPSASEASASSTKSIDNLKHDKIPIKLNISESRCKNDSLIISDTISQFKKKIFYWGDGDSSVYKKNETIKSHFYANSGSYTIRMVCDSLRPYEGKVSIVCDQPDSTDFSIYSLKYSLKKTYVSNDTLKFKKNFTLIVDAIDEKSTWLIDGKRHKNYDTIPFNQYGTIKIIFKLGGTFRNCPCDSTITLTFAPL